MEDETKTRNQLINELIELRQQITELKDSGTLSKQAEETLLHESEETYKAIIGQNADSIYLADIETRQILQANQTFQRLLGYNSDEITKLTIYAFVNHEREDIDDKINLLVKGQNYFVGERRYRRKDGTLLDVEVSVTLVPYKDRNALCAIARDITERKRMEQEMKLLASIVKNIPDAICSMDVNGNIVSWNEGAEKMLGYRADEIIGRPFTITIPNELAQKELDHCTNVLKTEAFFVGYETLRLAKGGRIVPVEITAVALKDEEQNITNYTSIMRDISEHKKAQKEIVKRVKELEDFYDIAIGRELKMIELKEKIEELKKEIEKYKNL